MTRTLISKTMRIGRAAVLATIPGDPFKLGQLNAMNRVSQLVGSTKGMLLKVDNNGCSPALFLEANAARPPLVVNATAGTATNGLPNGAPSLWPRRDG